MLTIRPARAEDAAAILTVHREAILARAAGHYPPEALAAWGAGVTPERLARAHQRLADPAFLTLIAEAGGAVIGFAEAAPARGELRALYVKANGIGRVGTALLFELEKRAFTETGSLTCDASLNAAPFYAAHGYVEEARTEHLLSAGIALPCVRMKKVRRTTKE